jgi:LmbE family N-acetylglucosaminyl deacetylase
MNVLALGAHPDDVEIGMGGTVARHADSGDSVTMVVVTSFPENDTDERWTEAADAADILGCGIEILDVPHEDIRADRDFVGVIDGLLAAYEPDAVYVPWQYDSHQDHRHLTRATLAATRKNRESVYMYEPTVPGGITATPFAPQRYVDVTGTMDRKLESLRAHASQVEKHGDSWLTAVEGRAMHRGYQANCAYAEAFSVVKEFADV